MLGRGSRGRAVRWLAPVVVGLAVVATGGAGAAVAVHGLAGQRGAARTVPVADPLPPTLPWSAPSASPSEDLPQGALSELAAASRARPAPVPRSSAAPAVRTLGTLHVPDLLVRVPAGLSPGQIAALDALRGVSALTALDLGSVPLASGALRVAGVDPSAFRAFTPRQTAASDPLWQAVARGELAASYGLARERGLQLGRDLALPGGPVRLGALAAFAVPGVDLVVDRAVAARLGTRRSTAVLLSAPERSIDPLSQAVRAVLGSGAQLTVLRPAPVHLDAGRPRTYRELYQQSARYCPGLSWTVLAAIGQIESGHGRNLGPSSAGALGPMQFLPSTWALFGVDGDRDGTADIMSPFDAVPSAALYLCRFGAGRDQQGLYDAVYAYNHADWYVREVLALAAQYR